MKLKLFCRLFFLIMFVPSFLLGKTLNVGDEVPAVKVVIDTGEELDIAEVFKKGPTLVYFYPKSDTPGCTNQACNIRDNFGLLRNMGVQVIGVSKDSVRNQAAFREKYALPFPLVADEDGLLGNAFGVQTLVGIAYRRQSFLVVDGKVAWRDLSATPNSQSEDAIEALRAL